MTQICKLQSFTGNRYSLSTKSFAFIYGIWQVFVHGFRQREQQQPGYQRQDTKHNQWLNLTKRTTYQLTLKYVNTRDIKLFYKTNTKYMETDKIAKTPAKKSHMNSLQKYRNTQVIFKVSLYVFKYCFMANSFILNDKQKLKMWLKTKRRLLDYAVYLVLNDSKWYDIAVQETDMYGLVSNYSSFTFSLMSNRSIELSDIDIFTLNRLEKSQVQIDVDRISHALKGREVLDGANMV